MKGAVAAGPSWVGVRAPHFTAGETEAQRRQVTGRRQHTGWGKAPQLSGLGQHTPRGLVLQAEAGAGAVDVVTGAAVVQQAGRWGGALCR